MPGLDTGWKDILVAVEYEGDHHGTDRRRFKKDIRRIETLTDIGCIRARREPTAQPRTRSGGRRPNS
jgi:hypothetical protein